MPRCSHDVQTGAGYECSACVTTVTPAGERTEEDTRAFADRIAQAIGDPGASIGRKLGPSWGVGNAGYSEREETVTRWSTRAVLFLLAGEYTGVSDVQAEVLEQVEALRREIAEHGDLRSRASESWCKHREPDGLRLDGEAWKKRVAIMARLDRIEQLTRGER